MFRLIRVYMREKCIDPFFLLSDSYAVKAKTAGFFICNQNIVCNVCLLEGGIPCQQK